MKPIIYMPSQKTIQSSVCIETEIAFSVEFNGIRNKISFEMYQQLSKENVIDVLNRLFLSFQTKNDDLSHKIKDIEEYIKQHPQ